VIGDPSGAIGALATGLVPAAWLHDLDKYVFRISGDFGLRWYGVAYAAGFVIGLLAMRWMAKRGLILIPRDRALDAILTLVFGVLLGGRLGYVAFYDQQLLWDFSTAFPWWGVLRIWDGGMASHGGMIGVIIACARISRGWKDESGDLIGRCPTLHVMDAVALLCTPGLMLGRLANFVNGELLGRIVAAPDEPAPWWAVRYPQELLTRHAPELTLEQSLRLRAVLDRVALPSDTEVGAVERLIAQVQTGRADVIAELAPLISARHPSQLYQALAEGALLGLALLLIWRKPRLPGVIAAWFLILYGVLRVVTEYWRLPDDHLAVQRIAGLSRGQWLSVLMVVAGAALLAIVMRRGGIRLGGWGRRRGGADEAGATQASS
jgi:phosphatidylglycerol:prolipoprotein diacylglycerol transferase